MQEKERHHRPDIAFLVLTLLTVSPLWAQRVGQSGPGLLILPVPGS